MQNADPLGFARPHLEQFKDNAPPHLIQKFRFVGFVLPHLLHWIALPDSELMVSVADFFCFDCLNEILQGGCGYFSLLHAPFLELQERDNLV